MSKPRPEWKDDFIPVQPEWILYDSETDRIKFRHARSQKEAIKKALALGIQPRKSLDVCPRDRGVHMDIMKPHEFRAFMDSLTD